MDNFRSSFLNGLNPPLATYEVLFYQLLQSAIATSINCQDKLKLERYSGIPSLFEVTTPYTCIPGHVLCVSLYCQVDEDVDLEVVYNCNIFIVSDSPTLATRYAFLMASTSLVYFYYNFVYSLICIFVR